MDFLTEIGPSRSQITVINVVDLKYLLSKDFSILNIVRTTRRSKGKSYKTSPVSIC